MGPEYTVKTRYVADASQARSEIAGLASVADWASGMFDRLAERAMFALKVALATGVGAAVGGLKVGLSDVNAQIEQTQIGLASTFQMLNAAQDFGGGMGMAKELLAGIREDAAALPGEFQDFANMARTLTPALVNAGLGVKGIRDFTRETAVAGANFLGGDFATAAREMSALIQGRAGTHNVLGTRMGITTATQINGRGFNEATTAERLAFIQKMLAKGDDALKAYQNSWAGLSSTILDTAKQFAGKATEPLFERIKQSMKFAIDWADRHKGQIDQLATTIGTKLVAAYDWLVARGQWIADNWSKIRSTAVKFVEDLRAAFERAWPTIQRIGEFIGSKLKDPTNALKELLGVRVGLGIASKAPSIISGVSSLMGGGGGAAAGGAGAAAGAVGFGAVVAAIAGLIAVMDDFAGSASTAKAIMADLSSAASSFMPLIEQGGALRDLADVVGSVVVQLASISVDQLKALSQGLGYLNERWKDLKTGTANLISGAQNLQDQQSAQLQMEATLEKAAGALKIALEGLVSPLWAVGSAVKHIVEAIAGTHENQAQGGPIKLVIHTKGRTAEEIGWASPEAKAAHDKWMAEQAAEQAKGKGGIPAGAGGSVVHNTIQFTVLADSDPERFAMNVSTFLARVSRYPTKGAGIPTFRQE